MICKYRNGAIIDDGVILNACVSSKFVIIDPNAITASKNHWNVSGITSATRSYPVIPPKMNIAVIMITAVIAV